MRIKVKKTLNNRKKRVILISITLMLIAAIIFIIWGNTTVGTTYFDISSGLIPAAFDGFKIAQISDLHNADFGSGNSPILDILRKEQPDIIAFTGDFADSNHTDIDIAAAFAKEATAIAPCYYVTGNHEARLKERYYELEKMLISCGVTVLHNESRLITMGGDSILLAGIDDPDFASSESGIFDLAEGIAAAKIDGLQLGEGYSILLSHRPELFELYTKKGICLTLSGHAHGGQFRLPFIGGLVAPNQGFFPKYDSGLYQKEESAMVVSRGLGNSIIPIRFNNRPEIVIVSLRSK